MEPLETFASFPFFQKFQEEQLRFLAGCAEEVHFATGDFLLREGDAASALYVLTKGRVALEVHLPGRGATRMETLTQGDILGLSWLFPPYRWQLDARSVSAVEALRLDGQKLREKMETDPLFGFALAKPLLSQLYERLTRVRLQRLDLYSTEPGGE